MSGEVKVFGSMGILNVGEGDTKLTFDKDNPVECIRAARIVRDMLRRGYALLVEDPNPAQDGKKIYRRVVDFDDTRYEYIIADFEPTPPEVVSATTTGAAVVAEQLEDEPDPIDPLPKKKHKGKRRIPAEKTSGVAVARTAGG